MIRGIAVVVALAVVCGRIGLAIGNWWVDGRMPNAELEGAIPPFLGTALGAMAGLGVGLWIAYVLGRRERS